jgi:hypothetical protein
MKIRYNIADQKKVNYFKFAFLTAILAILSLALIAAGVYQLSTNAKHFREDRQKLQLLKEKNENIKKREAQQNSDIAKIKVKWGRKLLFINNIIKDKTFPYLTKLNKLEELFPEGVFVENITLNCKYNELVQMTIAAISYQKLLESYKIFFKYNLVVLNQTETNGLFKASITIRLKNETKNK